MQEVTNSIANLIWPVLVVVVVWRLFPTLQRVIASRSFTVKVAGFEFTAQEATEKLVQSTAELQSRLAELDRSTSPAVTNQEGLGPTPLKGTAPARPTSAPFPRLLWVDDIPDRRAYELAQLKALGVEVEIARSTGAALDLLSSHSFDAVVTGMARSEDRAYSPTAGLTLLQAARASSYRGPILVFAASLSPSVVQKIEASGGEVVRNSMQLFEALWATQGRQTDN
jgi:CheY-like chemotaxis protein